MSTSSEALTVSGVENDTPIPPSTKPPLLNLVISSKTDFATDNETLSAKPGRPRKHASAAERQADYRARNTVITLRADPSVLATLKKIATATDLTVNEVVNQVLKCGLSNHDWYAQPMFGRALPNAAGKTSRTTKVLP